MTFEEMVEKAAVVINEETKFMADAMTERALTAAGVPELLAERDEAERRRKVAERDRDETLERFEPLREGAKRFEYERNEWRERALSTYRERDEAREAARDFATALGEVEPLVTYEVGEGWGAEVFARHPGYEAKP